MNRFLSIATIAGVLAATAVELRASVSFQNGRLAYQTDDRGNRVPDFSYAGYAGADRAIPDVPVRVTVSPQGGDSTRRIQQAIDHVASLPLDTNGFRGAVLLLKGRHEVFGGLTLNASGVVLRGEGMGEDGTTLVAARTDRRTLIRILGENDRKVQTNRNWQIVAYVPVGARTLELRDATGLKSGDTIQVIRPSTLAWIEQLGAAQFGGGIGGGWKPGSRDIAWDRVIQSVQGNMITIDAPITTAIENPGSAPSSGSAPGGSGYVNAYTWPGRITNVAVENLRLESAFDAANAKDENHSWCAITMEHAADAWVRQVTFKHFAGSAVAVYETCKRVTVQDCLSLAPVSEEGGYRRHTFFTMGQQTLFLRCYAEYGRHDFSVGHCAPGPNAFVQCEARLPLADSGPIESWASGVLYDNVTIDGNALTLGYRPGSGAGIGWAAANSVLWQCNAAVIRCWNPPGARNWSFGSWAQFEGDGEWRSSNNFVSPDSLYAGQLRDRLGSAAVERLRMMPRPRGESSNPPLDKAQELAAEARDPAPQLRDYIAAAGQREPIRSERREAKTAEEILSGDATAKSADAERSSTQKQLAISNGWLAVDGKLLIGSTAGVAWWRGNIRPADAASVGLGVTRFVPGRIGPGFTDDLNQVAETLVSGGRAALDHNYGLWYDRRRDDHQRVRRMDGNVLPPFLEQPFARSGQGTAWDGLSRYDLTKFNPWYWSRLREFATVCEQRGLVLFHQNYFQHNILEAGAHWSDSPWRTANNINGTGFPEPPNYAGDKRIFMAEPFYDVTHPVRRELHRSYIRQCLENFSGKANVIQFTSAEFTGPLHFTQFWLDTIAEWKANRSRTNAPNPAGSLIALSATKDVQDAILSDAKREPIVDVIDFRYWWRTDRGEFAPPGGKNLAPRQFQRQSGGGGRPDDQNLASMAAEYRAKHPSKPIICDFDTAGWAWVCAGGSMPRLPKTTDERLLAAIPRMQPWEHVTKPGRWALREPGKQMLIYTGTSEALDLSSESGSFRVNVVRPQTGQVTPGQVVKSGEIVHLPGATVIWLTKE